MPPHPYADVRARPFLPSLLRLRFLSRLYVLWKYGRIPQQSDVHQKAIAPEPAFEDLLRTLDVGEDLITAQKVNMINDRETFVGRDDKEAGFKNIAPDLGIDLENGGLAHKREMSRLISAWMQARIASEAKHQVDAVAKAHGVPTTLLPEDYNVYDVVFPDKVREAYPG